MSDDVSPAEDHERVLRADAQLSAAISIGNCIPSRFDVSMGVGDDQLTPLLTALRETHFARADAIRSSAGSDTEGGRIAAVLAAYPPELSASAHIVAARALFDEVHKSREDNGPDVIDRFDAVELDRDPRFDELLLAVASEHSDAARSIRASSAATSERAGAGVVHGGVDNEAAAACLVAARNAARPARDALAQPATEARPHLSRPSARQERSPGR